VTTRNFAVALALGVLICACCVGTAAQSCIPAGAPVPSTNDPCAGWFGYQSGQGPLRPGAQCVCGTPLSGSGAGTASCFVNLCSKHNCPNCTNAGSPINVATGNTFIAETDVKIPGLGGGLTLVRTWNSRLRASLSSMGMFGPNWRSTYEEHIYVDDDNTIGYARADGTVWNFVSGAGAFTPTPPANVLFTYGPVAPANTTASLFYTSTNWTLIFQNGEQRVFDATSGNLLSIMDRNGNTTQLTYDASYRLTTVTDPVSRHLYFSYASPTSYLVTSVTSDVGISLSYAYDGQGRLIQYTKPDQTTVSFQYNDPISFLITAVLDANGQVLESHTYDSHGMGLTSSRAGGVEAVTITYPAFAWIFVEP
jgi:YD repeat-containing protein